jgi:hypothetical protein
VSNLLAREGCFANAFGGSQRHVNNTMLDFLLSLFAGWPAILMTVILAAYGLVKNNYRFLLGAAILAIPFSWFLSGFPVIRSPIFLTPVLVFGSAWAMRYGREMLAWILAIPFFLVVLLLLFAVASGAS